MGYMGPTSESKHYNNHASARRFPVQVGEFVQHELSCQALYGPYDNPHFAEWLHIAPLMTKEKSDPTKRRLITDLSYQDSLSINSFVQKNTLLGNIHHHVLPTVDTFLHEFRHFGHNSYMFTFDVKRAYKNFRTCPLDWPLFGLKWESKYYLDTTLPFGSRVIIRPENCPGNYQTPKGSGNTLHYVPGRSDSHRTHPGHSQLSLQYCQDPNSGPGPARGSRKNAAACVKWLGILFNSNDMSMSVPPTSWMTQ